MLHTGLLGSAFAVAVVVGGIIGAFYLTKPGGVKGLVALLHEYSTRFQLYPFSLLHSKQVNWIPI